MNIEESNKLIALFMGGVPIGDGSVRLEGEHYYYRTHQTNPVHDKYLEYHTSWDWLDPVIEKIEALDDMELGGVEISQMCRIYTSGQSFDITYNEGDALKSTHAAVASFIKHYYNKRYENEHRRRK